MSVIFLRHDGGAPEIRSNFRSVDDRTFARHPVVAEGDLLWRWGSFSNFPDVPLAVQINPLSVCITAANKPRVRRLCSENGIRIPPTFYTPDEARGHFTTSTTPLLWRPTSHHAGQDMVVVHNASEVVREDGYWTKILQKTNEYRVYVLFGKVIGVDEKIVEDRSQLAWNHALGGRFVVLPWRRWPSPACWFSTKLTSLIGLHFGAVDLIKFEGRFYVLEVNTSPAMTTVYKVGLLQKSVAWLDSQITEGHELPAIASPLTEMVRGYANYIHPLHNNGERQG